MWSVWDFTCFDEDVTIVTVLCVTGFQCQPWLLPGVLQMHRGGGQREMITVRYYSSLNMQQELPNMQALSLYRIAENF